MIRKYTLLPALLLTAITGHAQTEKFGMASFSPPTGWQRIDPNGVLVFHDYKTSNDLSNFCQLFLFLWHRRPDFIFFEIRLNR